MKNLSYGNIIITALVLLGFWFTMSGFFDLIHGSIGILCVAFVLVVNYRLRQFKYYDDDADVLHELRFVRLIWYVPWLAYQIILSGLQVTRIIITPSLPINPRVMRFQVDLPNAQAKMILGNSITLTPGTLTVEIRDDEFLVHALVPEAINSLVSDAMPRQVLKLFEKEEHQVIRDIEIITDPDKIS